MLHHGCRCHPHAFFSAKTDQPRRSGREEEHTVGGWWIILGEELEEKEKEKEGVVPIPGRLHPTSGQS
jgi:hypothetical protein